MAHLAIKGHKERGKEVIALLEMLGGKNGPTASCEGIMENHGYYIDDNQKIAFVESKHCSMLLGREAFTLEEFEELYPYKLRNKVLYKDTCRWNVHWIKGMEWIDDEIRYAIDYGDGFSLTNIKVKDLKPYVEEEKKPSPDKAKAPALEGQDYSEGRIGYRIPEGFELDKIEDGEIILKPKKKVLPKTYKECCEVLGIDHNLYLDLNHGDISGEYKPNGYTQNAVYLFNKLYMVLICRDAYWKLAGDWEPAHQPGKDNTFYTIHKFNNEIIKSKTSHRHSLLEFPTEEMRNTFYDNFRDLIEECKELL